MIVKQSEILSDLVLPTLANQQRQFSGMDSLELCFDQNHFRQYPYPIDYQYNSRGFRDDEWPTDMEKLKNSIWCLGDSFTVGIGQPLSHIWPRVLQQITGRQCINVSMHGASNDWIYRRALDIMRCVGPQHMIVMWSYTHRRESSRDDLPDEQRGIYATQCSPEEDYWYWANLSNSLHAVDSSIIQLTVPDFHDLFPEDLWATIKGDDWPACPATVIELEKLSISILTEIKNSHRCYDRLKKLIMDRPKNFPILLSDIIHIAQRLDWARDHHHFDILTSQWIVDRIMQRNPMISNDMIATGMES